MGNPTLSDCLGVSADVPRRIALNTGVNPVMVSCGDSSTTNAVGFLADSL